MAKNAVVTGASSGVGQAVAIRLAQQGWRVAILARREAQLKETVAKAGDSGKQILPIPCDIAQESEVRAASEKILSAFGSVQALVNAAGTNAPKRALEVLTFDTYKQIVDVNLTGAFLCTQALLPGMRKQKDGTIVNIISDAGLIANAKAGPAYVASKFGVTGLTQSINAEERGNGVRACAIFPGDIDTPLLEKRPVPPSPDARKNMLTPDDVADCVMLAINLPPRAIVEQLLVRPR
jgi:NAD(P)-dependent dehydrogenase (short-subunit alcohol dehydrogenase family)